MADKAQGSVVFTPIVTLAADPDTDAKDTIHHDMKGRLGGPCTLTFDADDDDKWFYAPNVIVTDTHGNELFASASDETDLVGASGDQVNGPNEAVGSAVTFTDGTLADCSADRVWWLFIKNTGTSDVSGTTTTNSVTFTLDAGTAAYNMEDQLNIGPGEAFMSRLNGTFMNQIKIISVKARQAGYPATVNGSKNVRCTVAAIIQDAA